MSTFVVQMPPALRLTDAEFELLTAANRKLRIELSAKYSY